MLRPLGGGHGGAMGKAIGSALPMAVGIALSPISIIAMVLVLTSSKARANGPAYIGGWLLGLGIVGAVVLAAAGASGAATTSGAATPAWESWLGIALGILLLWEAVQQFRERPRGGEQPEMPKWMSTIDKTTPLAALGVGALLSGLNPKNLLLAIAGAGAIAQTGIPGWQQAIAYVIFALVGTLGVGAPVIIYFAMGKRSEELLASLKNWMTQHNSVIVSVLCLVIAAKLIGDAVAALTG